MIEIGNRSNKKSKMKKFIDIRQRYKKGKNKIKLDWGPKKRLGYNDNNIEIVNNDVERNKINLKKKNKKTKNRINMYN